MSGESGHRVLDHLGLQAREYDRVIRTYIPAYDDMVATVVRWLDGHLPAGGLVVDLGTGTGALSVAILDALRPGGVLLVADVAVHEEGPERHRIFAEWSASMQTHGITAAEAEVHFAQWAGEDRYFPLVAELGALAAAGFPRPECFWRHGPSTVFGGFRD